MDPYDSIRDQLQKAQQRGVDALTNRITFINESLAKVIEEARNTIGEAAPADPNELLPVDEFTELIDAARGLQMRAEEHASELEARVEELERQLEEAQAAALRSPGLSLDLLRQLDAARSQSELLKELLPLLLEYVSRAAVLVIREGTVSAWSGAGFADVEHLKSWHSDISASEVLDRFASLGRVVTFTPSADPVFSQWLTGEKAPSEAWLIPVDLRGRVVGALYIDRLEDGPWNPEAAQGLVALACWLIDTLSFRTVAPSPMLAEPVAAGPQAASQPAGDEEATAAPAYGETPAMGYPPVGAAEPAAEVETEATPGDMIQGVEPAGEKAPAGAATVDEAGLAVEAVEAPVETSPETGERAGYSEAISATNMGEQAGYEPAAPPEEAAELTEIPEVAPVVPPTVQPLVPPASETAQVETLSEQPEELSPEERAAHEEAERFARLLVSEIKLYNPEEVARGKESKDLYQRLKDDIDRSREMYEARISKTIQSSHDYFRDQLVKILADGDEEALGM